MHRYLSVSSYDEDLSGLGSYVIEAMRGEHARHAQRLEAIEAARPDWSERAVMILARRSARSDAGGAESTLFLASSNLLYQESKAKVTTTRFVDVHA